jgi:exoribonuclease-2
MSRSKSHPTRHDLAAIATQAMRERGLWPEFAPEVQQQLDGITGPARDAGRGTDAAPRDLRSLLWCSIDNDDSRDLDQLSVCEVLPAGAVRVFVAIADVDALVPQGSAIDQHARHNTTSVYTGARIFPMLPEKLSTDLSSLNPQVDRLAIVTEMVFQPDGSLAASALSQAWVHNHAQLAYDAVSAWLDGTGPLPPAAAAVPGLEAQLRTQDAVAQQLRARRREHGALEFQTLAPKAVFDGDEVVDLRLQEQNRARQLIEELMIATNACTARFLAAHGRMSLRRVVRSPERWARIVEVAGELGTVLPPEPDAAALEEFLLVQRRRDPLRFPDLSLVIVKLMGRGEYVAEGVTGLPIGHFGLAERDYTHATAPNRRYPDLITQRLVKAVLRKQASPYGAAELHALAQQCSQQEARADKVERQVRKSEAAVLLQSRIGEVFDAVVTGQADAGNWVRVLTPPVDGKLATVGRRLRVGTPLRVQLQSVDVARGFIDFAAVG